MHPNVRRPLFDGVREVRALWFDVPLIGEAEARRRILAHWEFGARLHRVLDGYLLEFACAQRHRCADLDGLPLCEHDGVLASAPLTAEERAGVPHARVWLIRGARIEVCTPGAADLIHPADWLDLRRIPICEPLRPPPLKAAVAIDAPEGAKPLREILGAAIPAPSREREAFLRDAADALSQGKPVRRSAQRPGVPQVIGAVSLGVAGLLAGWIGGLISGKGGSAGGGVAGKVKPSALSPWAQRLVNASAQLAMLTRVSKLIGWRQASYLRKMLDKFENGDLQDALRHAIPLDSLAPNTPRPSFGAPRPRADLSISGPNRTAAAIGVGNELQQHLRQTYRRTFERLDREGKIDEAVFVLAELLSAGSEAVTYLERHGRIRQAAELAETMELSSEIAIRLWWMAGEPERAARLARLTNAFADAVRLLEKSHAAEAVALRKLWAEHLAARGELTEAVEAIWPLEQHREQAVFWLLQAERSGGTLGIRALARKLALQPATLADSEQAIVALLAAEGEEGARLRARMADELLVLKEHSPATRRLMTELIRHVVPERIAGLNQIEKRDINRLLQLADTALLKADLPPFNLPGIASASPLATRSTPATASLEERGLLPIQDACRLDGDQYLLALGESGVMRVDRRGRQLAHYPVPAHHLVLADNGQRALALAARDQTFRISRLDLSSSKVMDWISLPCTFWAQRYDGAIWNAVVDGRIVAIDTMQDRLAVIWQVADLPGRIIDFIEDRQRQTILFATPEGLEQWRYMLPARRLNQRDGFAAPDSDVWRVLSGSNSNVPFKLSLLSSEQDTSLIIQRDGYPHRARLALGAIARDPQVSIQGNWLLTVVDDGSSGSCLIADLQHANLKAALALPHAVCPRVRAHDGRILFFDRCGRLMDVDCSSGQVHSLTFS